MLRPLGDYLLRSITWSYNGQKFIHRRACWYDVFEANLSAVTTCRLNMSRKTCWMWTYQLARRTCWLRVGSSRKQNLVADSLIWHTIPLTTIENQVNEFTILKDIYVSDNDFWENLEQLKNPIVGNMDLIQSKYFMKYHYLLNYAFQLVLCDKILSNNFTVVAWKKFFERIIHYP